MKRKNKEPRLIDTITNDIGEKIYIYDGDDGEMRIKEANFYPSFGQTGEQWCPNCHIKCEHHKKDGYFECPSCGYNIWDDEAEYGDGYSCLEATYEDDFGYDNYSDISEIPEGCSACGGPYPNCIDGCNLFDD